VLQALTQMKAQLHALPVLLVKVVIQETLMALLPALLVTIPIWEMLSATHALLDICVLILMVVE
jgi:hypothetical protein